MFPAELANLVRAQSQRGGAKSCEGEMQEVIRCLHKTDLNQEMCATEIKG